MEEQTLRNLQGSLFIGEPQRRRNRYGKLYTFYAGVVNVEGIEYTIHAFKKTGKSGKPWLTMTLRPAPQDLDGILEDSEWEV